MQLQFSDKFSVYACMWLCNLLDLVPAKENPSLGRLELRLLLFASFYFFLSVHERNSFVVNSAERRSGGAPGETPNGLGANATLSGVAP
jgi:hypothetical protein